MRLGYGYSTRRKPGSGISLDAVTQAFISAAGITDSTLKNAENTWLLAVRPSIADADFIMRYPIVGGTATTHKFNFYNPQNTDGAYRLAYSGSVTHSANGMASNGLTGTANTFWTPSMLSGTDFTLGMYIRTNSATNGCDTGCAIATARFYVYLKFVALSTNMTFFQAADNSTTITDLNTSGFWLISKTGTTVTVRRNDVVVWSFTASGTLKATSQLRIMSTTSISNVAQEFSNRQNAGYFLISRGVSAGEATVLYNAEIARQTAYGRNV